MNGARAVANNCVDVLEHNGRKCIVRIRCDTRRSALDDVFMATRAAGKDVRVMLDRRDGVLKQKVWILYDVWVQQRRNACAPQFKPTE